MDMLTAMCPFIYTKNTEKNCANKQETVLESNSEHNLPSCWRVNLPTSQVADNNGQLTDNEVKSTNS